MASTGVGSPPHLALELFKGSSGANVLHVPYRGAAPAVTDVVGGQVHAMFADLPVLMPQIRGGTLRPIGVGIEAARFRVARCADARRAGHQGRLRRQLVCAVRAGKDARAGDRQAQRRGERRAEGSRRSASKLIDAGADPAAGTPEQLAEFLKSELERWGKVVKEKNIKEGT